MYYLAENQIIFKRGVNIDQFAMCYISIDSFRQALQINRIFFFFFHISISFSNNWPKTEEYSNRVNIVQSAMYYISIDSPRQALQTIGKLFLNCGIIFWISYNFLK